MAKTRFMGVRGSVRCSLVGLLAIAGACSTEYNRPAGSRTNGSSNGGSVATGTGGSGGFPVVSTGGTTATGGRGATEPPGDDAFTFVNGIVDAKSVLLCLTAGSGSSLRGVGSPFPEGGLDYGASLVLSDLTELELSDEGFAPVVIAGELDLVEGMDCEEAVATARAEQAAPPEAPDTGSAGAASDDAGAGGSGGAPVAELPPAPGDGELGGFSGIGGEGGGPSEPPPPPPRLRLGVLPIAPASVLASGFSVLMVGVGCIGGPAFVANEATLACGEFYSGTQPTLSAVLVRMSRQRAAGRLALQVLQASTATEEIEVRTAPLMPVTELPLTLTTRLGFGAIAPEPPRLDYPGTSYGAGSSLWGVQVLQGGSVLYLESWADLLERSQLTIEDGRGYTLVYVGPGVGLPARYFWNAPRVVVVENDPTLVQ